MPNGIPESYIQILPRKQGLKPGEARVTTYKRVIVISLILLTLIAFDHSTKWMAIQYLADTGETYRFCGDLFRLQYAENTGAFLSLGAGLPDGVRAYIMTGLNTVILGALLLYIVFSKNIALLPLYAFTLVAAGGIGNLIDRIFRHGRVVDFMNMGLNINQFQIRTGIFNVADVAIMVGLFLIIFNEVVQIIRGKKQKNKPEPKSE